MTYHGAGLRIPNQTILRQGNWDWYTHRTSYASPIGA
jgi:hypothetical protein